MLFLLFLITTVWGMAQDVHAEDVLAPDVYINEFLPNPIGSDNDLEFIELHNRSDVGLDISDWKFQNASGQTFAISSSTTIGSGEYLVFYSAETGSLLANTGDRSIRLLDTDDTVIHEVNYSGSKEGYSYNRTNDGLYEQGSLLTPGAENDFLVSPTPTPIPEPTPTPAPNGVPTPTPPIVYSGEIHINEFLPNPKGEDATGEFIEMINKSSESVDISEWVLDDVVDTGSTPFTIPDETIIAGNGFLTLYRPLTKISLNNNTDHVRLIRPDGVIQDDITYATVRDGHSWNRTDGENFELSSTITPNSANTITAPSSPTPKPTAETEDEEESTFSYDYSSKIVINEFLPNPNGDDTAQEYIEIKSLDTRKIRLIGWAIDDGVGGSSPYRFADGDTISPNQILVLFRSKTKIALNNDQDIVQLLDPNKKIVSTVTYKPKIIEGQSFNRTVEGIFMWSEELTPGKENTIFIREKESPTPKPKTVKKSASVVRRPGATPAVLSATVAANTLSWPEVSEGTVSRSVEFTGNPPGILHGRQGVFVVFGMSVATMQLLSGMKAKEKIWQK